jgi:hypothetical protein
MELQKGDRVKNRKILDWGLGQILDSLGRDNYEIFFVNVGVKEVKATVADLVKITGKEAQHPLLDNLCLPGQNKKSEYKTFQEKVSFFLRIFPKGFYDDRYLEQERDYKVEAHKLMLSLLDEKQLSKKIEADKYDEICKDALRVVNKTNLIFPNEKMALKDGLQNPENRRQFAMSLHGLLYRNGEMSKRFQEFAACLESLNASKWTIQTYFPFIAFPDEHMFMKPTVTQLAADAFAFELNYKSDLNWNSYESLLKLSRYVSAELARYEEYLRPRDMIDVQSFMWCSAPGKKSQGIHAQRNTQTLGDD